MLVEPSKELAYWLGVAQSDGCFCKSVEKGRSAPRYTISLEVSKKSLPMMTKFSALSKILLKRSSVIYKQGRGTFATSIRVADLRNSFEYLDIRFRDPPTPPNWSLRNPAFFGAYLAGLIDGDGDIHYKISKYSQCSVRIASSLPQAELQESIKTILNCGVSVGKRETKSYLGDRYIEGTCYVLEFFISPKTYKFVEEFILPYIQLDYKKAKVKTYIDSRWSN